MPKFDRKKVLRSVAANDAVFVYISACCTAQAEKPACAVEVGNRTGMFPGAKPTGEATLGSWRCSTCRKPCKVSRHVNKKEVSA